MDEEKTEALNEWLEVEERLCGILKRKTTPEEDSYLHKLNRVNFVLINEEYVVRPYDSAGLPGGIIELEKAIPTIIVPDLHARMDFFLSTMRYEPEEGSSVISLLSRGEIQVVCVGDGFHAEGRAAKRWQLAYNEYKGKFRKRKNMNEEMRESLGVMEMVMEVKSAFPGYFHFLKGNHENIANEQGGGNHPFRKYSYEGPMVTQYMQQFYSEEFFETYYEFEKNLPLFAIGRNFVISHAEPARFFDRDDIVEYRERPDVVEGLTWTANNEAEDGSVDEMLQHYLNVDENEKVYHFGGHRPVRGLYHLRADGRYVQIHNPERFIIAMIRPEGEIDLERDILVVEEGEQNCNSYQSL
jgi:hypothetical protein